MIYRWIIGYTGGDLSGELNHAITEAKNSHHRLPASWRPRNIGSMASYKPEICRNRKVSGVIPNLKPKVWKLVISWSPKPKNMKFRI